MEEESDFLPNQRGRRVDGRVDRISNLPDEILFVILSFLKLREAAATSVLSSRWLHLWKHIPHIKLDRLSLLPDQIIAVILSFLSLREATATSVLSSRWSHLWKHTPNLNFDMHMLCDYNSEDDDPGYILWNTQRCKCIEIVNTIIQSHKALSLKRFRLALHVNGSDKCTVTKWLKFAFSRQVESLELNFIIGESEQFVLGELLRENRICLQPQTDLIFFQSLKILRLSFLKVSGEDIELFLRDCPLLEELTIKLVNLTSDLQLCGANLTLKHLEIHLAQLNPKSIKISAPNLTYMRLADDGWKLFLENLPKLVEADFALCTPEIVVQRFADIASCHFSQLQVLNITLFNSETFFQLLVTLANGFTQMPNLKKLVIWCLVTNIDRSLLQVPALIWAYPRLEEFQLMFNAVGNQQPAYMQVMTDVGRSPHQHLKVFELQMSSGQSVTDDIVKLVTYISNHCVALRKVIIGSLWTSNGPAKRDYLTRQLQGKVPNHIQLELFSSTSFCSDHVPSLQLIWFWPRL